MRSWLSGLVIMLSMQPAFTASHWAGVWHLTTRHGDRAGQAYLLQVGELSEGIAVRSTDGRPYEVSSLQVDEEKLLFSVSFSEKKPTPISFALSEGPHGLQGTWTFVHPQYPASGEAIGSRLLDSGEWNPLAKLQQATKEGWIDTVSNLVKNSSKMKLAGFSKFWMDSYLPETLLLNEEWLRQSPGQNHPEAVYHQLRKGKAIELEKRGPLLSRWLRRAQMEQDVTTFLTASPVYARGVRKIVLWTGPEHPREKEACCGEKTRLPSRYENYLILNPLLIPEETPDLLIAKELIRVLFWGEEPTPLGVRLFREGLALLVAQRESSDMVPLTASISDQMKARLLAELEHPWSDKGSDYLPQSWNMDQPGYAVAAEFAGKLLEDSSLDELRSLKNREILAEWKKFLAPAQQSSK